MGRHVVWIAATGQRLAHHDGLSWPDLAGGDCCSEQSSKCHNWLVVEDWGGRMRLALLKASAV